MGVPQNGQCFLRENPNLKWMMTGITPIFVGNLHKLWKKKTIGFCHAMISRRTLVARSPNEGILADGGPLAEDHLAPQLGTASLRIQVYFKQLFPCSMNCGTQNMSKLHPECDIFHH